MNVRPPTGRQALSPPVTTPGGDRDVSRHPRRALLILALLVGAPVSSPFRADATASQSDLRFDGPLVIRKGGVYRGNWESLDPKVPAVYIETREPVVIEHSTIRGRGHLIRGWWLNLTVRDTRAYGLNPDDPTLTPGRFILAEDVLDLRVENNEVVGTSGIYVNVFRGDTAAGQTIQILRNIIRNVDGRYSDGQGGYRADRYRVQAVQFNKVRNVPGVEIAWNQVINEPGRSAPEENINIYESSGTPHSPIRIHNNYIQGAYPPDPLRPQDYSGGGIIIGDGEQHDLDVAGGHVHVYQNHVVGTTNQGVAIAGGHNQHVYENRVLSSGRLPDGSVVAYQNVGMYVHDYAKGAERTPSTFFGNVVRDNIIGWVRHNVDGTTWLNNTWTPSCTEAHKTICTNNQAFAKLVTPDDERQEFQIWLEKVLAAGVKIGPRSTP